MVRFSRHKTIYGVKLAHQFDILVITCHTKNLEAPFEVLLTEEYIMSGDRITARVAPENRQILELGTTLSGASSLNQFIVKAALDKAHALIAAQESLNISSVAADAFFTAMINPTKPNEHLINATKAYMESDKGNGEFNFPITRQEKA